MIVGRDLTDGERELSMRYYAAFNLVNGASYMCLGESVLILFAVHLNAPNFFVALLGAMVFLGYVLMPAGVLRTAKVGAAACQADFWVCRNFAALAVASAAVLVDVSRPIALAVVALGAFFFYGFRAAGVVLAMPLAADVAKRDDVPLLVSRNAEYFYLSGVVSLVAIFVLLAWRESVWTLSGIMAFGAVLGLAASTFVRRIRETGEVPRAARRPLLPGMRAAVAGADIRKLMSGWFACNVMQAVVVPILVLAMKRGCGFSDVEALCVTIANIAAAAAFSKFSGRLCCGLGPRFVMVACGLAFPAVALAWLAMPAGAGPLATRIVAYASFALLGAGVIAIQNAATSYFLMVCPEKNEQIPASIATQLVVSAGAGILAPLVSGCLVRLAERFAGTSGGFFAGDLGVFRLYFAIALPLLVILQLPVRRMRRVVYEYKASHGVGGTVNAIRMAEAWRLHLLRH